MIKRIFLMLIPVLGIFFACSFKNDATATKTTVISYYSDSFNGKKTASGDTFYNSKFTAANRSLPFGTKVKMTNLKNGKSVIVTINDRGPFHSSRALDVSKAAFGAISELQHGIATVEYEVVED